MWFSCSPHVPLAYERTSSMTRKPRNQRQSGQIPRSGIARLPSIPPGRGNAASSALHPPKLHTQCLLPAAPQCASWGWCRTPAHTVKAHTALPGPPRRSPPLLSAGAENASERPGTEGGQRTGERDETR